MRVLFVGNSQMRACNLPSMVRVLSESAPAEAPRIEFEDVATGGRTLQRHWDAGTEPDTTRGLIARGGWDAVVVQEIYSASREDFEHYATLFDDAIRAAGSRMILFATASVTRHYKPEYRYPESFREMNDMQIAFGRSRGIPVVAAGYAWMRYLGSDPTEPQLLDLYHPDKGHPGPKGSYIYACLLYAVLTGRTPVGLTRCVNDIVIDEGEAARMQQAAWDESRQPYAWLAEV